MRQGNRTPPVSEGEEVEMKCISIGKKGDGVFKKDNFVIIVPDTEVDETYNVRITKVLPTIAFGEKVE